MESNLTNDEWKLLDELLLQGRPTNEQPRKVRKLLKKLKPVKFEQFNTGVGELPPIQTERPTFVVPNNANVEYLVLSDYDEKLEEYNKQSILCCEKCLKKEIKELRERKCKDFRIFKEIYI